MIYGEGFYKADGITLLYGPGPIYGPTYTLDPEQKDTYQYPVDGWTWFNTPAEAMTAYGLPIQGINNTEVIRVAYLKAALAQINKLDVVNSAVTDPVQKALWSSATEIKRTDPNMIQVAQALSIDLDDLWSRALAIRAGIV